MSLLTQILGGLTGTSSSSQEATRPGSKLSPVLMALLPVVLSMLSQRGRQSGGLGEILGQLTQRGYGQQAASWVGTGANEALPPEAIDDVFDADELNQMAQSAGISQDQTRAGLSELLPEVVDHFTPDGDMPEGQSLVASVDDYLRRLS